MAFRILSIALIISALNLPGNQSAAYGSDIPEYIVDTDIGQVMNTFLTRLEAFGFHGTALVAKDGQILLHNAYGIADVPSGTKNYTATLFSTGSVTKQFTAAAIMNLEMAGKLSTSDSIGRFFDDVPVEKMGITVHHLLTHSAGFEGHYGPDNEPINRDDMVRLLLKKPLLYEPGSRYHYSNAGYSMLAAIIEVVSGMEYEVYLRDNLFLPCGMQYTGLHVLDVDDTLVAHSHNKNLGYVSPKDRPREHFHLKGSGGLLSTTADMYRWHLALKNRTFLPDSVLQEIFTPYIAEDEQGRSHYGYGWAIQESSRGTKVYWHNGGAMPHGWSCAIYRYVDDDAVFIIFSNRPYDGALPVDDIVFSLASILFGTEYSLPPSVIGLSAEEIGKYSGEYVADDGASLIVNSGDSTLIVSPLNQAAADLLFPSPFAPRLAKYNDWTVEAITAMARGDFEGASSRFDIETADSSKWVRMLREWWREFDSLGNFQSAEPVVSIFAGGVQTFCRVNFSHGSASCKFFWMAERCGGLLSGQTLDKEFYPQSQNRFIHFELRESNLTAVKLQDKGKLTVEGLDIERIFSRQ